MVHYVLIVENGNMMLKVPVVVELVILLVCLLALQSTVLCVYCAMTMFSCYQCHLTIAVEVLLNSI